MTTNRKYNQNIPEKITPQGNVIYIENKTKKSTVLTTHLLHLKKSKLLWILCSSSGRLLSPAKFQNFLYYMKSTVETTDTTYKCKQTAAALALCSIL